MAVFNLREVPDEVALAVRVEAAKRAMSLRAWILETIRLRLKMNPVKPKESKTSERVSR